MQKPIAASELILNPDGSVYHLNLKPEHIARTIILVGDQDRVARVSKYFDRVDFKMQKREFVTHTGHLGGKCLSVVSTGIGTDNVDIVLNELDALVNIDLETRMVKKELTSLDFIRIGTTGSLNKNIGVDQFVVSAFGIGLENLMNFYAYEHAEHERALQNIFEKFLKKVGIPMSPNVTEGSPALIQTLGKGIKKGITLTCGGFYGPQGRQLRMKSILSDSFFKQAGELEFEGIPLSNFEMETSAIYGLAKMLGHRAVSFNAIIADRINNEFSKKPKETVEELIKLVLGRVALKVESKKWKVD